MQQQFTAGRVPVFREHAAERRRFGQTKPKLTPVVVRMEYDIWARTMPYAA
jgi:hypothetical protein